MSKAAWAVHAAGQSVASMQTELRAKIVADALNYYISQSQANAIRAAQMLLSIVENVDLVGSQIRPARTLDDGLSDVYAAAILNDIIGRDPDGIGYLAFKFKNIGNKPALEMVIVASYQQRKDKAIQRRMAGA